MTEDLTKLSAEELRELLKKEEAQSEELKKEVMKVEKELEELGRSNEKQEEGLMATLDKQIKKLKADNNAMALRIEREDEFVKNTLKEKYDLVLKEKADLEAALDKEKATVIVRIKQEIERINKETEGIAAILDDPDKVNAALKGVLDAGNSMKKTCEAELAELRKEVEKLLAINNALLQRVSAVQLEIMTEPEKTADNFVHESPEMKMRRYSTIATSPYNRRGNMPH